MEKKIKLVKKRFLCYVLSVVNFFREFWDDLESLPNQFFFTKYLKIHTYRYDNFCHFQRLS